MIATWTDKRFLGWQPVISLAESRAPWPRVWHIVHGELCRRGYSRGTRCLYRQVLRTFSHHANVPPNRVTTAHIKSCLYTLNAKRCTWSWIGINISMLRTILDKLGGLRVTLTSVTPRRPFRLPHTLSPANARCALTAGTTLRNQLLLGFLYGCGLKVSEACGLRWRDVNAEKGTVRVIFDRNSRQRQVRLPNDLLPILKEGGARCPADSFIFPGRAPHRPLAARTAEAIVRQAATDAGLGARVTGMTLRHSYALHSLEAGANIRELQEALGHARVETTLIYQKLLVPADAVSPLDQAATSGVPCSKDTPSPLRGEGKGEGVLSSDRAPQPSPLFPKPLTAKPFDLPFPPEAGLWDRGHAFYRTLKAQLRGRFLALCRGVSPPCNSA